MSGPAPTKWISWKSDQNCDLYRNFFFYIYKYINIADSLSGTSKTKNVTTPTSPPSEVEGVGIVVISFRNIAKNRMSRENLGRSKDGQRWGDPVMSPHLQILGKIKN